MAERSQDELRMVGQKLPTALELEREGWGNRGRPARAGQREDAWGKKEPREPGLAISRKHKERPGGWSWTREPISQ